MTQPASQVNGGLSKYILEKFWSQNSSSETLVFLVLLLFFFPSKPFSLYAKRNALWLSLANFMKWMFEGHLTLLKPVISPTFFHCMNPIWVSVPQRAQLPILLISTFVFLFFLDLSLHVPAFFIFLFFSSSFQLF